MVAVARDRLDAAVQGRADDLGAQRVALVVGAAEAEQRPHVRRQVAQLPVRTRARSAGRGGREFICVSTSCTSTRLSVCQSADSSLRLLSTARRQVLGDPLAQRARERRPGTMPRLRRSSCMALKHQLALGGPGGVLRLHRREFRPRIARRRGRRPDQVHGCVERGLRAWFDRIHLSGDAPRRLRRAQSTSRAGESSSSMRAKNPRRVVALRHARRLSRATRRPRRLAFSASARRGSRAAARCPRAVAARAAAARRGAAG